MKHRSAHATMGGWLLPLALLLAMLAACRKEPQKIILHGRFTEYGTGKPIQGARLYLGCEGGVPFGGSTYDLADSIVSDAEGKFRKEYTLGEICGNLSLTPWKQGYFKGELRFHTTDNPFMDIVLDPMAWLKVVTVPDGGENVNLLISGDFLGAERLKCVIWGSAFGRAVL
jgi:hypothetical protein